MEESNKHTEGQVPMVSVIMATYNCSNTLQFAIESVLLQQYTNFEIWVIGDCCTDDSAAVVLSFNDPRINWYNRSINSGSQSAPNNDGIQRAKGKYIAYLGHDDLWFPNYLSAMVAHLEANDLDLVHCLCPLLGPQGVIELKGPLGKNGRYSNYHIPPTSWLHKKSIADVCGYWSNANETIVGVDIDFLSKVDDHKFKIACLPELLVLKFPSAAWTLYSRTHNFPQENFLKEIKEDPSRVLLKILPQISLCLSRYHAYHLSLKESLDIFLKTLRNSLLDLYSRKRWPLNVLLLKKHQSARKKFRKKRGL